MAEATTNGHKDVEVEVDKQSAPIMVEIGSTGLNALSGYIYEEFQRELQGYRATRTYRDMRDNDSVIGALFFAVEMLIRQVEWRFEPSEDDTAGEWSDFCEGAIHDLSLPWEDTLASWLTFLQFGWHYSEVCYKERNGYQSDESGIPSSHYADGMVGWRKFAPRAQETLWKWQFDDSGGIQGMWQAVQGQPPVFIPIEKALLFRTTTRKDSPEGVSILRSAYVSWYYKKHIQEIEAIGIERDLAGLPVMEAPLKIFRPDASPADKTTFGILQRLVRNIKRDEQEGVLIPQEYDGNGNKLYNLSLLATGGRRQMDTDVVVGRYDQRIAMSVLADFILLGHEKVGSFALSSSRIELFATALSAWLDSIAETFNAHAIPRLMRLNGVDPLMSPHLRHAEIERADLAVLGDYIAKLAGAGMPLFPDEELETHLRAAADLPEKATTSPEV